MTTWKYKQAFLNNKTSFSCFVSAQVKNNQGVTRGAYDGPVYDIPLNPKYLTPAPSAKTSPTSHQPPPIRNLHQSNFSLSGNRKQDTLELKRILHYIFKVLVQNVIF